MYEVQAKVFDKDEGVPGECDAVLSGDIFPVIDDKLVTEEVVAAVIEGVTKAIEKSTEFTHRVCDESIRHVATQALFAALPHRK